jgi:hypothetical protein
VFEKSTRNEVDYAAKSSTARYRAVLLWPMQFWLAKSLPRNRIQTIQSLKKEIPDKTVATALIAAATALPACVKELNMSMASLVTSE